MREHLADAVVIGGGPAGCSAAITLRQEGLQPILLEQRPFPRYHIGESLLPMGLVELAELGVGERIAAEQFVVKPGARFYSRADDLDVTLAFASGTAQQTAYQVERARFDEILLGAARETGVDIWMPAKATDVAVESGGVRVRVVRDGEYELIKAPFLLDASGRQTLCARAAGRYRNIRDLLTHAYYGYFEGLERAPGPEGGNIIIVICPGGWLWWIPLRKQITSIGVVLKQGAARPEGSPEHVLLSFMGQWLPPTSRSYLECMRGQVRVQSSINYCATRYADDRVVLVGDAAAFLDPLFSTGVFTGIFGARRAARTAAAGLRKGDLSRAAFLGYERELRTMHQVFLYFIRRFYDRRFLPMLRSADTDALVKQQIVGILAGDIYNPANSLASAVARRANPRLPLSEA